MLINFLPIFRRNWFESLYDAEFGHDERLRMIKIGKFLGLKQWGYTLCGILPGLVFFNRIQKVSEIG